jgi:hypothetical protein
MLLITAPVGRVTGMVCIAPTADASGTVTEIVPEVAVCEPPVEINPLLVVENVTADVAAPLHNTWLDTVFT